MFVEQILAAARECIGTPFRHQGRVCGVAIDCAGLVVHVATRLGLDYCDVRGYSRIPGSGALASALDAQPCLVVARDMQAGDVLLMRFVSEPQHLAIYAGDTIIHAYQNAGKCCEHRLDDLWRNRIVAGYRFIAP